MKLRRAVVTLLPVLALLLPAMPAAHAHAPGYTSRILVGHSAQHRPIWAYHFGASTGRPIVIIGQIHGDEHAGVTLVRSILTAGRRISGGNLYLIPTVNPDGNARNTRANAHGVDLNRNWPAHWRALTNRCYTGPDPLVHAGGCYSGRRPLSEPETAALHAWLLKTLPRYLLVLHQPLGGVDSSDGTAADAPLRHRLSVNLGLPSKSFTCWSYCYGSLLTWYTLVHHYGSGITIEFGFTPSTRYLTGRAAKGVLGALGLRYS